MKIKINKKNNKIIKYLFTTYEYRYYPIFKKTHLDFFIEANPDLSKYTIYTE